MERYVWFFHIDPFGAKHQIFLRPDVKEAILDSVRYPLKYRFTTMENEPEGFVKRSRHFWLGRTAEMEIESISFDGKTFMDTILMVDGKGYQRIDGGISISRLEYETEKEFDDRRPNKIFSPPMDGFWGMKRQGYLWGM